MHDDHPMHVRFTTLFRIKRKTKPFQFLRLSIIFSATSNLQSQVSLR